MLRRSLHKKIINSQNYAPLVLLARLISLEICARSETRCYYRGKRYAELFHIQFFQVMLTIGFMSLAFFARFPLF